MDLRKLNDEQLEQSFHRAVKTERKIMHIVVLHVQEVHRRQLHLKRAKGDLKKYLISEMKYSSSAADRRIEAAKLLNAVPAVAEKLESGELNLSQVGELHRAIQQAEKIHQEKVTNSYKAKLVSSVLGQTKFQTQQTCAEMLAIPVVEIQSVRNQKDDSKRVEFTFTEAQFEKFEKVKGILAHKNLQKKRTQSIPDILETAFDEIIQAQLVFEKKSKAKSEMHSKSEAKSKNQTHTDADPSNSTEPNPAEDLTQSRTAAGTDAPLAKPNQQDTWRTLTSRRKKLILQRDECCQYKDQSTGDICGSTFNLHVDHVQTKQTGGGNNPRNLRALCRAHNLYRNRCKEPARATPTPGAVP